MKWIKKSLLLVMISFFSLFTAHGQTPVIQTSQFILKIGDDVRLRSGGPAMTIESIRQNKVICNFFNRRFEFEMQEFDAEELELLQINVPEEYNLEEQDMLAKILIKLVMLKNNLA